MKLSFLISFLMSALVVLVIAGCTSSSESTRDEEEMPPPPPPMEEPTAQPKPSVAPKVDTVSVEVQNTQRPSYEPKPTTQATRGTPTGRFSVQIGAYSMPDNAERIAALAKERFYRNVYTVFDESDNLYKVMIGDFNSKDEARRFRDEMVQQFPDEYGDAWVAENPQR